MKQTILSFLMFVLAIPFCAQEKDTRHEVLLETTAGNIRIALYNETPLHRDNFLKLTRKGFYDGVLFHRVIPNFMIQTGDSLSRYAHPGDRVGDSPEYYQIPAEIVYPKYFHKRGAVAAAREPDKVNPQRASSASQFYIVWGRKHSDASLDNIQKNMTKATDGKATMPAEQREYYKEVGGTPHLDAQYTVFGEVLEGMEVVDKIQQVECDENDRPCDDVRIIRATVIR
ncbi:peptidylprolyl isomerase [Hoylesella marshii]|uniref:peptidylprolyl isomerase n=2 Tax=Hoylesella marshii TaxID=189722 RepID=E0NQL5_9BACT|nr:peptidylprolyl isomerase [Hoylesella marshii]EFM02589.1 peptidyl-prolyl cis-trans isomerase, cyclophilin-type [Hoylesella marshii DSM 16973 = JCM 13450]